VGVTTLRTEQQRNVARAYYARPDQIEKRKLRNALPEIKAAIQEAKRKWRNAPGNILEIENKRLFREYGITLVEYNQLFESQVGCCAICRTHQLEFQNRLAVDHCHSTGKVRGLLCRPCNMALGLLKEDSAIILAAAQYVKDFEWN